MSVVRREIPLERVVVFSADSDALNLIETFNTLPIASTDTYLVRCLRESRRMRDSHSQTENH